METVSTAVADTSEPESRGKEKQAGSGGASGAQDDQTPDSTTRKSNNNGYRTQDVMEERDEEDDEEEEDDEDEEPQLKYGSLTKSISGVYRNGDATSACLLSGDKMIVGTHNGTLHVYAVPSFERLRVYRAHSASVTSISISPFPLPPPEMSTMLDGEYIAPDSSKSSPQARQPALPHTPWNSIYIASSSIDGNVCVASLIDQKDVLLRNFGRPVQSVALSPKYKNDRTYLSGGLAGQLVRTIGGRIGTSSNSTLAGGTNTHSSSWLGTFGLGGLTGNNGTDTVLHSGEGAISTIKWSLSGKIIVWVNEEGIKFMRSNLELESSESELAWTRIGHVDRPNLPGWEEMASVWKARVEWVDENTIERDNDSNIPNMENGHMKRLEVEKLVVGWGGTVWIINVFPARLGLGNPTRERKPVEIATKFRMDCLISGVSLYTPSQLLVLSYIIPDEKDVKSQPKQAGPGRGIRHWRNGLQPELRLVDINSKEELSADTLTFQRYETLTASDYHLGVLPPFRIPSSSTTHKGTLESIGTGLLDATLYPVRLFSSATSIRSHGSSGDKGSSVRAEGSLSSPATFRDKQARDLAVSAAKGVKIFIHSPYDCVVAVKRGIGDRLTWLTAHERYEEAWNLIDRHPDIITSTNDDESGPPTPTPHQESLADFFQDDTASFMQARRELENSKAEKEKRRIGERWLEQLIGDGKWEKAGQVCGKVLNTTDMWEKWIWVFAKNHRFDEIVEHVPTDIHPPLPPLTYEVFLGHYVSRDRLKLQHLLEAWPPSLFDTGSVIAAIEDQLKTAAEGSKDWRIFMDCIARLFLAEGHYREALQCYIRLQDAETAMGLIREHHLLDAVVDDIPAFVLIRIPKEKLKSSPVAELEEAASEPLNLLVRDVANGIVRPEAVVSQLQAADLKLFLYFYFKRLWTGEAAASATERRASRMRGHHRTDAAEKLVADEGRALVDSFADTVVELFADYDRPLLMEFLKSNTAYSYNAASSICERRHFTHELIYLFSKTGQTKRALQLILSDLKDISHAISFAKSQDDPDLWDELLSYSMDKPEYIRCLLTEGGTAVDPIKLVRRIPSGLEIVGLREGLTRLIREHDIQASISQGVAKVLIGEVAGRMKKLRDGQRRGIKFDIAIGENGEVGPGGRCAGCQRPFVEQEQESLVGFACGHIYHVSHLQEDKTEEEQPSMTPSEEQVEDTSPFFSRTVGLKVTNARLLRDKVGAGCRICLSKASVRSEVVTSS
ncbi:hypothetical protein VTO42DRAFT_5355 [Malbranchea cinnamomea]